MPTIALLLLLITVGVVAFVLLWPRVRSGPGALLWGMITAAQRLPW